MDDLNLDVDFDRTGSADNPTNIARVMVADVYSHIRDGTAPTISIDCENYTAFEQEVERLKRELERMLAPAREFFSGERQQAAGPRKGEPEPRSVSEAATSPKPRLNSQLTVGEVMTRAPKTLQPNDQLCLAEQMMERGQLRHVVVVDERGRLAGLVSRRDILFNRLARSMGHGKRAHDAALDALPVKQVMQTEVTSVAPEAGLSEAGRLMREQKIGCLPVLSGIDLVGILTTDDFLAVLSHD